MIPVRSQWGRYNLPKSIYRLTTSSPTHKPLVPPTPQPRLSWASVGPPATLRVANQRREPAHPQGSMDGCPKSMVETMISWFHDHDHDDDDDDDDDDDAGGGGGGGGVLIFFSINSGTNRWAGLSRKESQRVL